MSTPRRRWFQLTIGAQFAALIAMVVIACLVAVVVLRQRTADTIHFVVPDGFRGPFVVIEDKDAPELPIVNGCYVVNVPQTRVLPIHSDAAFRHWTSREAEFVSGAPLRCGDGIPSGPTDGETMLRSMGWSGSTNHEGHHNFFVGTLAEAQASDFDRIAP